MGKRPISSMLDSTGAARCRVANSAGGSRSAPVRGSSLSSTIQVLDRASGASAGSAASLTK